MSEKIKLSKEEKETIRSMHCCINGYCKDDRGPCPYLKDTKVDCTAKVMKKALDLLERVQPGISEVI